MIRTVLEITHGALERECCPLHEAEAGPYVWEVVVPEPLQAGAWRKQTWPYYYAYNSHLAQLNDEQIDAHHRRLYDR